MRNLLNFLIKYRAWFVFIFYVLVSCVLIVSGSAYRLSVYMTSANAVTATLNEATSGVTGYFNLSSVNASLEQRTAQLEAEVLNLREQLNCYQAIVGDTLGRDAAMQQARFSYILAPVISSTWHRPRNYITISKGRQDGVRPGMGVVDHNGVVGVVNACSGHTARIVSLLNEAQPFSVKLKDTPYVGTLWWKGNDRKIAYMVEVPRHAKYHTGDTVVTSGYSTTFPAGIHVGTVMGAVRGDDDNYFTLKVRLATDFANLTAVRVIKDVRRAEIDTLAKYDLK
ncbi:MAG TPA: rod shape-determining protein MreC [Porphyromonadaceae bacterium]|nr:rod shape-determining protein MreC [Porphyromonadaceae bacterium]